MKILLKEPVPRSERNQYFLYKILNTTVKNALTVQTARAVRGQDAA